MHYFKNFSDAVSHIVMVKSGGQPNINYLDDFLFVALLKAFCNGQVNMFIHICGLIKFPVSLEKTHFACTRLVFLGLLIDTVAQLVLIPIGKIEKAQTLIESVLGKKSKKITIGQLQKICSFLNFLGRCVVPGRAFTRCLYSYLNDKLKPHHHIRITAEMRGDLEMWLEFVNHPTIYARPFADFSREIKAPEIQMYSDAAKRLGLGYGGVCQDSWMFGVWDDYFIKECDQSIEYLELYALTGMVLNWIHRYKNRRVTLFCDNQAVVQMVNNTSSSCKNCMVLIRMIVLKCLKENIRLYATYIKSKENTASDFLSRQKISKFLALKQTWEAEPTPISGQLTPIMNIWIK